MTRNRRKNGFLTIAAPAWRLYSPRPLIYCPCPLALLPLPTSSDYGLAVYPALFFSESVFRNYQTQRPFSITFPLCLERFYLPNAEWVNIDLSDYLLHSLNALYAFQCF